MYTLPMLSTPRRAPTPSYHCCRAAAAAAVLAKPCPAYLCDNEEEVDPHSHQQHDGQHVEGPGGGVLTAQDSSTDDQEHKQAHKPSADRGQEPAERSAAKQRRAVNNAVSAGQTVRCSQPAGCNMNAGDLNHCVQLQHCASCTRITGRRLGSRAQKQGSLSISTTVLTMR